MRTANTELHGLLELGSPLFADELLYRELFYPIPPVMMILGPGQRDFRPQSSCINYIRDPAHAQNLLFAELCKELFKGRPPIGAHVSVDFSQ